MEICKNVCHQNVSAKCLFAIKVHSTLKVNLNRFQYNVYLIWPWSWLFHIDEYSKFDFFLLKKTTVKQIFVFVVRDLSCLRCQRVQSDSVTRLFCIVSPWIQPTWAPDKQAEMILLKDSFSRRYSRNNGLRAG